MENTLKKLGEMLQNYQIKVQNNQILEDDSEIKIKKK